MGVFVLKIPGISLYGHFAAITWSVNLDVNKMAVWCILLAMYFKIFILTERLKPIKISNVLNQNIWQFPLSRMTGAFYCIHFHIHAFMYLNVFIYLFITLQIGQCLLSWVRCSSLNQVVEYKMVTHCSCQRLKIVLPCMVWR